MNDEFYALLICLPRMFPFVVICLLAKVIHVGGHKGELTYGKIGEWRFDKRSHLRAPPPKNLPLPPKGVPESVVCPFNFFASG